MQSVSSRIWTRVAVSNSYDDNNYTTGTFKTFILAVAKVSEFECQSYNYFHFHFRTNTLWESEDSTYP